MTITWPVSLFKLLKFSVVRMEVNILELQWHRT
jgi:hypothetical protein